LQTQLTSFVGREGEVEKVAALLERLQTRLLTMTGPPGIGKTRLSLEVATRFLESTQFEDGVFFVPLAPIADPALVAATIAQTLNVKETSGQMPLETLKEFLRDKKLLLVLDNFEQIVPAGPMLGELLLACEGLKVLVTSREALHIYGEHVFHVPPLELPRKETQPTAETLEQSEAAELFVQRAQAARPDFVVDDESAPIVGEICRKLDGLPLAIELAAARANVLAPLGILSRLDHRLKLLTSGARDLTPRQQTLRGAIDWSYDLLKEDERSLFRHLSVFVGGCTLEAAEAIANAEGSASRTLLDLISSLLDKSMAREEEGADGQPRLIMLETIREYGLERLAESGEEGAVRQAYALYLVELAEQAEPYLTSAARAPWLARLDAELDNIRAALAWSLTEGGDAELGLRLAGALHWFWFFRSYITEGRRWLDSILSVPANKTRTVARAKALTAAANLARPHRAFAQVKALSEEGVEIWREAADGAGLARALTLLGVGKIQHDDQVGLVDIRQSVDSLREIGDKWHLAFTLDLLSDYDKPDLSEALYEESLLLYRQIGDKWGMANELFELGREALVQGNFDKARLQLEEAILLGTNVWDKWSNAHAIRMLGMVNQFEGNYALAETLFQRCVEMYREVGDMQRAASSYRSLGDLAYRMQNYQRSAAFYEQALDIYGQSGAQDLSVTCLAGLAQLAVVHGQWEMAAQYFGSVEAWPIPLRSRITNPEYIEYERVVSLVRDRLGQAAFDEARRKGATIKHEQAILDAHELSQLLPPTLSHDEKPARQVSAPVYPAGLSRREVELLRLVALGLSNAEIALRLFLSPNTVRAHLYSIYSKIGVTSRTAAAHFAVEYGLI
jgi:predicted ATPase/DNA-binding CsgD family transcriptional regulator